MMKAVAMLEARSSSRGSARAPLRGSSLPSACSSVVFGVSSGQDGEKNIGMAPSNQASQK